MTKRVIETGQEHLGRARRLLRQAQQSSRAVGAITPREQLARRSLTEFRHAMDWLEDTPAFAEAHRELDEAGRWVREQFDCQVTEEGGNYFQTCPVALAHSRVGLSPELILGGLLCSTCGENAEDSDACLHVAGRKYDSVECRTVHDSCNICGETIGRCDHRGGELYDGVECFRFVTKIEGVQGVAIVARPANPYARLQKVQLDLAEIQEELGAAFVPGMQLRCNYCLRPCSGVRELHNPEHKRI